MDFVRPVFETHFTISTWISLNLYSGLSFKADWSSIDSPVVRLERSPTQPVNPVIVLVLNRPMQRTKFKVLALIFKICLPIICVPRQGLAIDIGLFLRVHCRLKNCTCRSCRVAASSELKVPRFRRLPVAGLRLRE